MSILFLKPFGKTVALDPSERVGVAKTGRARLVDRSQLGSRGSISRHLNLNAISCPSLGSWSFPRSQAPHDDVRIGCLIVCNGVRASRHQPIDRGHHDHRPSGTSPARRTGPGTCKTRSGRRVAPVERRAIDPNAVKDHSDLARNCDLCLFHANALRELHSPGLEGRPFFGPIEKDGRCLE